MGVVCRRPCIVLAQGIIADMAIFGHVLRARLWQSPPCPPLVRGLIMSHNSAAGHWLKLGSWTVAGPAVILAPTRRSATEPS